LRRPSRLAQSPLLPSISPCFVSKSVANYRPPSATASRCISRAGAVTTTPSSSGRWPCDLVRRKGPGSDLVLIIEVDRHSPKTLHRSGRRRRPLDACPSRNHNVPARALAAGLQSRKSAVELKASSAWNLTCRSA